MNFPNAHKDDGSPATLCATDPDLFFPDEDLVYNSTKEARKTDPKIRLAERKKMEIAKGLCNSCEYTNNCLNTALMIQQADPNKIHPYGIWGGLSKKERTALQRRSNI